jgi:hypothetical protein
MPGRYDAGRFAYMMRFARLKEVTRDAFVLEALGTGETISLPRKKWRPVYVVERGHH